MTGRITNLARRQPGSKGAVAKTLKGEAVNEGAVPVESVLAVYSENAYGC